MVFLFLLLIISVNSHAALEVFTCEPEWKALVEELGGEKVSVISATTALQDPHHIEARPSLIAKIRNAQFLVCSGAGLEEAWLSLLLRQSGNKNLINASPNFLLAAELVERLEVPEKMDRSLGDIHALGNPHVHLDPHRLLFIAAEINKRLQRIDASNAAFYQLRFENFSTRWKASIQNWEAQAQDLKNKKVIVYHRNWSYFIDWLGIHEVGDLEPKPGLPPSSPHLIKLLQMVQEEKPDFILIAPYQDNKGAKWLSEKSGIPVRTLPFTVGGNAEADNLFSLYQNSLTQLKQIP